MAAPRRREAGFALPLTIFVITLVTIMLTGVLIRVQVDRRIAESSSDHVDVIAVAQSGLQTYLGTVNTDACDRALRPPDGDSTRVNVTGGYADVIAHLVRIPVDTLSGVWTYVIRSTGRLIEPPQGSEPQARHTVAQFAEWQPNYMDVEAAFIAANGLNPPTGGKGGFDGSDGATPGYCKFPDIHAIRVPAGESPNPLSGYSTKGKNPEVSQQGTGADVANQTNIDWLATTTGGLIPDYYGIQPWDPSYPIMFVAGDATMDVDWTWAWGTLIVTGDLTITGTRLYWYGLVLVGGRIHFLADQVYFDGLVMSGLNEQLGIDVPRGDLPTGGDKVDIDFDSRDISNALESLAGFAPVVNGWVENWTSY